MKINNMTAKTSLEIKDSDILVIQDEEDTKQVTVDEFRKFIMSTATIESKKLINQTLDNIAASLKASKYNVSVIKTYIIGAWIGSTSGNIQIILKDEDTNKWLTEEELIDFISKENFNIYIMSDDLLISAVSFEAKNFIENHPIATNPVLEADNAGFIKAHFDNLTQNEIANITYEDIILHQEDTEDFRYIFKHDENSFSNAIPYVDNI